MQRRRRCACMILYCNLISCYALYIKHFLRESGIHQIKHLSIAVQVYTLHDLCHDGLFQSSSCHARAIFFPPHSGVKGQTGWVWFSTLTYYDLLINNYHSCIKYLMFPVYMYNNYYVTINSDIINIINESYKFSYRVDLHPQ